MARIKLPAAYENRAAYEDRAAELAAELDGGAGVLCGIITRYLGPTNNRGSRIVAELAGGAGRPSVAVGYPYALNELGRHTLAAMALVDALNELDGPDSLDHMRIKGACATAEGYAFTIGRIIERGGRVAAPLAHSTKGENMSNGTISTAAGVRRYMRALGSKAARRSTPVLVYEGAHGYALGAHVGNGASVYAGNTATAHAAARGELAPARTISGGRIDALLSARGELAEVVRAADHIGGTASLRPIELAGAVAVELVGHGYGAAGLSWTARAATRDAAMRPIMAAVLVEAYTGPTGLRPRYVAADNYRLHVYGERMAAAHHSGLVPYQLAEYVAEAIEGATPKRKRGPSGELAAWIGRGVATYYGAVGVCVENHILIEAQGVAVRVDDTGASFPDYRGIIPAAGEHTARVVVGSSDIERGLRYTLDEARIIAARAGDRAPERFTLALGPSGTATCAITGRPDNEGEGGHVFTYAVAPTGSGEATMAAEYMLDALADRRGANVELLLHGEYRPVVVSGTLDGGASDRTAVIMPLRGVRNARAAELAGIEARELVAAK